MSASGIKDFEIAYKKCIHDFVEWVEKNWHLESKEKWPNFEPYPGDDYRNGYEAALEGLGGAVECYFDEYLHR